MATVGHAEPSVLARPASARAPTEAARKRARRRELVLRGVLFAAFYVVYAVLGLKLLVPWNLVPGDGISRLAHAFLVFYNDPPKLAAIGFVWPPILTIALLPVAVIRPLATSLDALPLVSAAFAAGTILVLERMLASVRMPAWQRLPLLVAFGVNPMILLYGANGMGEIVALFFLTLGTYAFVRWSLERRTSSLVQMAVAFGLGSITRYQIVFWALAIAVFVVVLLIRQHASRGEVEGSLITYLVPLAYALAGWCFVCWLVLGNPLAWYHLEKSTTARDAATTGVNAGLGRVVHDVLQVNAALFVPALVVLVALLVVGIVRRDAVALALAALLAIDPLYTAWLEYSKQQTFWLSLRYDMYVMPLTVIGIGWLFNVTRGSVGRTLVWGAALGLVVLAFPVTWSEMGSDRDVQSFTKAFVTAVRQRHAPPRAGAVFYVPDARAAASRIRALTRARHSVLTDDAITFAVVLTSGHPELFRNRIDKGDPYWLELRDSPWGRVGWVLVTNGGSPAYDLVLARYPGLAQGSRPGFREVYRNPQYILYRVAGTAPRGAAGGNAP